MVKRRALQAAASLTTSSFDHWSNSELRLEAAAVVKHGIDLRGAQQAHLPWLQRPPLLFHNRDFPLLSPASSPDLRVEGESGLLLTGAVQIVDPDTDLWYSPKSNATKPSRMQQNHRASAACSTGCEGYSTVWRGNHGEMKGNTLSAEYKVA